MRWYIKIKMAHEYNILKGSSLFKNELATVVFNRCYSNRRISAGDYFQLWIDSDVCCMLSGTVCVYQALDRETK